MKPCQTKSDCPCEGNPVGNFSSEKPDQDVFLGFNSGTIANRPSPGDKWTNPDGFYYCADGTSQLSADLCAAAGAVDNGVDGGGPGGDGVAADAGNRDPGTLYSNSEQSCTVPCLNGGQFTYTIPAGKVRDLSPILVDRIAASLACKQANAKLICLSSLKGNACLGDSYDQTITATASSNLTWALFSGILPPGLVLVAGSTTKSHRILGNPTVAGNYTFSLKVTDTEGNSTIKTFTIAVIGSNLASSPAGSIGVAYSFTITVTGGTAPYSFSIAGGTLPAGLTLSTSGLISGIPTTVQSSNFTVLIQDTSGGDCLDSTTVVVTQACTALPDANSGFSYHQDLYFGDPALEPWSVAIIAGSIPGGAAGWQLDVINIPGLFAEVFIQCGTNPSTTGNFLFTIRITDKNGAFFDTCYTLKVNP